MFISMENRLPDRECFKDYKDGMKSFGAAQGINNKLMRNGFKISVHYRLLPGLELHTVSSKECPQKMDGSMIQSKRICLQWKSQLRGILVS